MSGSSRYVYAICPKCGYENEKVIDTEDLALDKVYWSVCASCDEGLRSKIVVGYELLTWSREEDE